MKQRTAAPPRFRAKRYAKKTLLWVVPFIAILILAPGLEPRGLSGPIQSPARLIDNTSYQLHAPIVIIGNSGFSSPNGVIRGSGKVADPYAISGWQIDASSVNGITIVNTTSYFTIQGVNIFSGLRAIFLSNTTNGLIQNSVISNSAVDILVNHSSNISISNNNVTSSSTANQGGGIELDYCVAASVIGNRISGAPQGLLITYSPGSLISNNIIWHNTDGMSLQNTARAIVTGNNMSYNKGSGIVLFFSPFTNITSNSLSYNNIGINQYSSNPSYRPYNSPNATIAKNLVDWNSRNGIVIADNTTVIDNSVSFNGMAGINVGGENATIIRNTISFNGQGGITSNPLIMRGYPVTIENNTFTDDGIILSPIDHRHAALHPITPDNMINGKPLFFYEGCSNLNINGTQMGQMGQLILMNCRNIQMSNLQISHSDIGLEILNVNNTLITGSSFNSNTQTGIYVAASSNVTVIGNDLSNNRNGLVVYAEIGPLTAYHNNFFFDGAFVCCYLDKNGIWDNGYPSGGNYWSDYNGVDNCSGPMQNICPNPDGIGDSPIYLGLSGASDHYPLMKPIVQTQDTSPPTWLPSYQVSVTGVTQNSVTLYWITAADDVAVMNYTVYQGATPVATVSAKQFNFTYLPVPGFAYTVHNLTPSTTYNFTIVATDQAGKNTSSSPVTTKTQAQTTSNGPNGSNPSLLVQYWYIWVIVPAAIFSATLVVMRLRRRNKSNPRGPTSTSRA